MEIVRYQEELSPALPTVFGNVDYEEFRSNFLLRYQRERAENRNLGRRQRLRARSNPEQTAPPAPIESLSVVLEPSI